MSHFTAAIVYNADTLKKLGKVQNRSRVLHNLVYLTMCFLLVLAGLFFGIKTTRGLLCIALGSLGFPLCNAFGKAGTDNLIKALGNHEIHVDYEFFEKDFTAATQGKMTRTPYQSLLRLWEDNEYFYIFPIKNQGFMIERSSILPSAESFREQLSRETDLHWNRSANLMLINIKSVIYELKLALKKR